LDSTGERRAICALNPLKGGVSEIVTFVLREYYSLMRVDGSTIERVKRAISGKHDPTDLLVGGETRGVPCN
jgi:hypothetical protein